MHTLLKQKSAKLVFAAALGSMILLGCGQSSNQQQQQQGGKTQQPAANNNSNMIPSTGAPYPALAAANQSLLLNGTVSQSLVNIVKSSGKPVGVFEFVGVTCESCKTESPQAASQLSGLNVTRISVFPNKVNEYTAAEYQNFVNTYSPGARYAVDNDLALLKAIRSSNAQYFGIFVVVKSDGTGVVLNQTDALSQMLPAVQAALK